MEKVILTLDRPIDPDEMDDGAGVHIPIGHVGGDPSKIVRDASKSPLVLAPGETPPPEPPEPAGARGKSDRPAAPPGVQVIQRQPGEPLAALVPREQQVRQLRKAVAAKLSPEDASLAAFVRSLDMDPASVGLGEATEEPQETVEALPTRAAAVAPAPVGDLIENARNKALTVLCALPEGVEIFIGSGLGEDGVQFVMGLGILVGAKQVVYRGEGHYRLAPAVRAAMRAKT